ncbi:MAG: hypothetical protein WCV84_03955 [Patescibacteria group bacterium]
MQAEEEGLMRAMCFYDALDFPPTRAELVRGCDHVSRSAYHVSHIAHHVSSVQRLLDQGMLMETRGRLTFHGREAIVAEHELREGLFPRKIRNARRVARWLARLDGVRFVALCNTTALMHARDEGDLDFFIITRAGTVWQTRAWATLPFLLSRRRPAEVHGKKDAVCLSFFIDDTALDLSPLVLAGDDVYFRHWFLSLLPLYDDGIGQKFWEANAPLRLRHPYAKPWIVSSDLGVVRPCVRVPMPDFCERPARRVQSRAFPSSLQAIMNRDTCVVINEHVLKFHTDDGRAAFREAYIARCRTYGVAP